MNDHVKLVNLAEDPEEVAARLEAATEERGEPAMSLDELFASVREYVEEKVPTLRADDDVIAMSHIEGDFKSAIVVHPFNGDAGQKRVYDGLLPALVQAFRGRAFVTVQAIWMTTSDRLPEGMRPAQHPDRQEAISVLGSDGLVVRTYIAEVTRRDDGPAVLGPWLPNGEVPVREASWIGRVSASRVYFHRVGRAHRLWLMMRPAEWWTDEKLSDYAAMGVGSRSEEVVNAAWMRLFEMENGLAPGIVELVERDDFWSIPEPDCDTPAADLRVDMPW